MTSRRSSRSIPVESAVDPTRSQNITVSWRRSASGAAAGATGVGDTGGGAISATAGGSRLAAGGVGISACRKAGNGCGSAMGSGRATRPSGAQTSSCPSTSAATRLTPISSRRSSSRPS